MCGISGYYLSGKTLDSADTILRMVRPIAHRGPDDEGIAIFHPERSFSLDITTEATAKGVEGGIRREYTGAVPHRIAFGHRRFSVIDPSPAAHQPFWSRGREVCVCSNSEIYNYTELRKELEAHGHVFTTTSDTEVLVEAYLQWGEGCFERFNGFWAMSLYDTRNKGVLLSRDRIGKVPLYITRTHEGLWWSSEIKGLFAAMGNSSFTVRDQAVVDYVLGGWRDVFHNTFFEDISTFPSASFCWIQPDGRFKPKRYWNLPTRRLTEKDISSAEAAVKVRSLLSDATKIRRRADVQLVFNLSGGMDSSAIVALAAQENTPFDAITVTQAHGDSDDLGYARMVAGRFPGTVCHSILEPPEADLFDGLDNFFDLMEEPFHSPNLMISNMIYKAISRRGVRVAIEGAGGDEVFSGYARYFFPYLRYLIGTGRVGRFASELIGLKDNSYGGILRRLVLFASDSLRRSPVIPSLEGIFIHPHQITVSSGPSRDIQGLLSDSMGDWLMNYWFRSGDKCAMDVPIEERSPFLDHRVVDFAFILPIEYLIRDGWFKWILRKSVADILPSEIVWRRRKFGGLGFPLGHWLKESKSHFNSMFEGIQCPYLDFGKLEAEYQNLARRDPFSLWRTICLALWWKRCVLGEKLGL